MEVLLESSIVQATSSYSMYNLKERPHTVSTILSQSGANGSTKRLFLQCAPLKMLNKA